MFDRSGALDIRLSDWCCSVSIRAAYQLCEFKSRRGRTKKNCQLKNLILALLD